MADIIETKGNTTLVDTNSADTIKGKARNDLIVGNLGNDETLTGGSGNDKFVYKSVYSLFSDGNSIITDFGGIGKGSNPSAAVIAEVDTLIFQGSNLTAKNLLLTQNGSNLEISFEGEDNGKVILQNFALENLDNLSTVGNILFDGQTTIKDSFDVVNANSTQQNLFNKNTVTFFNDLDNYVIGFDNSDDVINGQGGNDYINGKSGDDLLRGGAGNDTLIGGAGNDTLVDDAGSNILYGGIGNDRLNVNGSKGDNLLNGGDGNDSFSAATAYNFSDIYYETSGNNTLNGGAGDDTFNIDSSSGDNLLNGDDGNDYLSASGGSSRYGFFQSLGNNTLNGGAGNDTLNIDISRGDNLLSGGDGNDYLSASGEYNPFAEDDSVTGKNTLYGGAGDDTLNIDYSRGNNLLCGGDDNDYLSASGSIDADNMVGASGKNTLNGGAGDDTLNVDNSTGNNLLSGDDGNDYLSASGASGNNTLKGGAGSDSLTGGNGNDALYGGSGVDTFVFNSYDQGVDSIYDFNAANELIYVSASGFDEGLLPNYLLPGQFTLGTSATTSAQRFIYDNSTGALYFDQDGSAKAFTQVKFAQLLGGVSLSENNFYVTA